MDTTIELEMNFTKGRTLRTVPSFLNALFNGDLTATDVALRLEIEKFAECLDRAQVTDYVGRIINLDTYRAMQLEFGPNEFGRTQTLMMSIMDTSGAIETYYDQDDPIISALETKHLMTGFEIANESLQLAIANYLKGAVSFYGNGGHYVNDGGGVAQVILGTVNGLHLDFSLVEQIHE